MTGTATTQPTQPLELTVPNPNRPVSQTPTANAPASPPTTGEQPQNSGTTLQRYDAADVTAVREAVAASTTQVGFTVNSEAMQNLLHTTMVENKRPRAVDGPMGAFWESMEPMMQRFMEMLMTAFGSLSDGMNNGQGNWADYGVMNSTSAAMSRVLNDIEGSGPGEGVFAGYQSRGVNGREGFTDNDLIKISYINGELRKAEEAGNTARVEQLRAERDRLDAENQQRFGLTSREMWDVFNADKRTLMENTVQAMAVQARENGLVDTSTDINRLMASYYSKGATEREIIDAMNQGIIPHGDINQVSPQDQQRIRDADLSLGAPSPSQTQSQADIVLPSVSSSTVSPSNSDVLPSAQPESQSTNPFANLGIAQGSMGNFSFAPVDNNRETAVLSQRPMTVEQQRDALSNLRVFTTTPENADITQIASQRLPRIEGIKTDCFGIG
jgi:hypothetical protein